MLKNRINQYFSFSKKERNGIIVLLFLCIVVIIIRIFLINSISNDISLTSEQFQAEVDEFEKSLKIKEIKSIPFQSQIKEENQWTIPKEPFFFDPNTVAETDLVKLGFTGKQINTLEKYRKKGGRFIEKADLLKVYGMTKDQYDALEPYIQIKELEKIVNLPKKEFDKPKQLKIIELNSATEQELTELNGIGESFAKRIFKYKEILGGFYAKEQILEIYGMDSTRYNMFVHQVIIDTLLIQKIDLNKASYEELIKKQYLSKYQVQAILKYRELKGEFLKPEDLISNKIIPQNVYNKMKPYLKIN